MKTLSHIETLNSYRCRLGALLRDKSGIAITEAVIVIPFFLIVWMGLITMHHMYEKRLEAQVISEGKAITVSIKGCKGDYDYGDDDSNAASNEANSQMESEHSDESGWLTSIAGEQPFAWKHTSGGKKLIASGIPELFGGPDRAVRASQKFMCNMEPKDGLWDMLFDIMKGALGWDSGESS